VSINSEVKPAPQSRGSRTVDAFETTSPIPTSGEPSRERVLATRRSQGARELERPADANAVDRGDHRHIEAQRHTRQLVEALDDRAPLRRFEVGGLLQVVARGEGAAGAAHDHDPHAVSGPRVAQRAGEPWQVVRRQRVQDARPLEDDVSNRAVERHVEPKLAHQPGSSPA
jgi:hypothetical protein